jgi:hypothetical protein
MTYHPLQRSVTARILTPLGFLTCSMRVPERSFLSDYLSHAPTFVALFDVTIEATGAHLNHFSIQHDSIHLLVPAAEETLIEAVPTESRAHRVLVATDQYTLEGTVQMLPGTRVSDTFAHRRGFFLVTGASLHGSLVRPNAAAFARVLVNADRIMGVADLDEGPHA